MSRLSSSLTCKRGLVSEETERQVSGDVVALSCHVVDTVAPVEKANAMLGNVNDRKVLQVWKLARVARLFCG